MVLVFRRGLVEVDILDASSLGHLPVETGNVVHVCVLDVHYEIAELTKKVVLSFAIRSCQPR